MNAGGSDSSTRIALLCFGILHRVRLWRDILTKTYYFINAGPSGRTV